jgi:hypothetical protein
LLAPSSSLITRAELQAPNLVTTNPRPRAAGAQPNRVFTAPPFFVFHYGACFEETAPDGTRQLVGRAPGRRRGLLAFCWDANRGWKEIVVQLWDGLTAV